MQFYIADLSDLAAETGGLALLLVFSIVYASTTKVTNYDPRLTLTYFTSRSNLITQAFVWEKVKILYVLELIAALCLKLA